MTKAIHCRVDNSVRTLNSDGSLTTCECGKVEGWWRDALNGLAVVHTPDRADRHLAHIISIHNGFLNDGPTMIPNTYQDQLTHSPMPFPPSQVDTFWRQLHQQVLLTPRAPETVRMWDQSSRACWVVIIEPGTTADTEWATEADAADKHKNAREVVRSRT